MNHTYNELCEVRWVRLTADHPNLDMVSIGAQVAPQPFLIYEVYRGKVAWTPDEYPVLVHLVHNGISCYVWQHWLEPAFSCDRPSKEEMGMLKMLGYKLPKELYDQIC